MGRGNAKYIKNMHQQAYDQLCSMQAFGESKYEDKRDESCADKIYSFSTFKTYWKHIKYFIKYVQVEHPDCKSFKKAKHYVSEWLENRVHAGLSAWTIHTEQAAVNKIYKISADDPERFQAPKRKRVNITRSRREAVRDQHFSVANNRELIQFCRGTGLRRSELQRLCGKDLITRSLIEKGINHLEKKSKMIGLSNYEQNMLRIYTDAWNMKEDYFIFVRRGKGGRVRICPIIGNNVSDIVERMRNTGLNEKVWKYVNPNADIHSYRSDYANMLYRNLARDIDSIPFDRINRGTGRRYQSEVYVCRKDEYGRKLDKKAMLIVSKALGHNRLDVVANYYLRGL